MVRFQQANVALGPRAKVDLRALVRAARAAQVKLSNLGRGYGTGRTRAAVVAMNLADALGPYGGVAEAIG